MPSQELHIMLDFNHSLLQCSSEMAAAGISYSSLNK